MKKSGNFSKTQMAIAMAAVVGASAATVPTSAEAAPAGHYVAGDFHNHTTCSDGSISMQKLIGKSTDKTDGSFGLDWFVQAGHGGNGNRNCTLVEDESLATPAYPLTSQGPTTTWLNSSPSVQPKGLVSGSGTSRNMWRWQAIQEFQYPLDEYLGTLKKVPVFTGVESNGPGHEHISMALITGQIPNAIDNRFANGKAPTGPVIAPNASRYTALGNADALAQWEYCFDRSDTDTSRGNTIVGSSIGNNWDCSVPGLANAGDESWNATAMKLIPSGASVGVKGHAKSIASLKWMEAFHPTASYYVPAHLERPGPFNPDGNNGYNIEHLRDFNNAAPDIAFGFETQPGHHASDNRGEYSVGRNTIGGVRVDSVGGTTYGGTGVYGAVVGGVWDAMLGEGRNWWFFGSSDWHNRGQFGPDDRRSTQDFYPGEYQRNYTLVRDRPNRARTTPQDIVDGLRTGNTFVTEGQLIDRLAFIACLAKPAAGGRADKVVAATALEAASGGESPSLKGCATMGEKLVVPSGSDVIVSIVARDPVGTSNSPYKFPNPSLAQVNISQPLNAPVLDHVDLIRGMVTGYKTPGTPEYSGEWPRNTDWLKADGTTTGLTAVPAGAKNLSAAVIKTFGNGGANGWTPVVGSDGTTYLQMTYRIPAVVATQYVRLRGTNLPASVPYETDASGNPLADVYTNAGDRSRLTIPCTTALTGIDQFSGCPDHLPTATAGPISGQKAVAYDVAAWSDLWFYSNPIYLEVDGGQVVAGVQ